MNNLPSLFQRLGQTCDNVIPKHLNITSAWEGHVIQKLQNDPSITLTVFTVANTLFLVLADQAAKHLTQNPEQEEGWTVNRLFKHLMVDILLVGGGGAAFNMILSKLTGCPLNKAVLAMIASAMVAARIFVQPEIKEPNHPETDDTHLTPRTIPSSPLFQQPQNETETKEPTHNEIETKEPNHPKTDDTHLTPHTILSPPLFQQPQNEAEIGDFQDSTSTPETPNPPQEVTEEPPVDTLQTTPANPINEPITTPPITPESAEHSEEQIFTPPRTPELTENSEKQIVTPPQPNPEKLSNPQVSEKLNPKPLQNTKNASENTLPPPKSPERPSSPLKQEEPSTPTRANKHVKPGLFALMGKLNLGQVGKTPAGQLPKPPPKTKAEPQPTPPPAQEHKKDLTTIQSVDQKVTDTLAKYNKSKAPHMLKKRPPSNYRTLSGRMKKIPPETQTENPKEEPIQKPEVQDQPSTPQKNNIDLTLIYDTPKDAELPPQTEPIVVQKETTPPSTPKRESNALAFLSLSPSGRKGRVNSDRLKIYLLSKVNENSTPATAEENEKIEKFNTSQQKVKRELLKSLLNASFISYNADNEQKIEKNVQAGVRGNTLKSILSSTAEEQSAIYLTLLRLNPSK